MSDTPYGVISSTAHDLPAHRAAARDACLRQDFFPMMMEHQAPSPADAVQLSRELVDQADVYILILGFRYGEVAAGQDKSFTHLELDRANERGIPKLVLLMSDEHPLKAADVETGRGAERVRELREHVRREQAVSYFSSPEELRALLIDGLSDMRNRLRPRAASLHHVKQIITPPQPYIAHPYTLLHTSEVIGRQRELNILTDWASPSDTAFNRARIMIFVSIGGIGKSALTWRWFNEVAPHEMQPLAGRVWWSFYESDARFDNFVARTLAYVSRLTLTQVQEMSVFEREEELLNALNREPYLIVLDGLERLLLAYSRLDAPYLADDEFETQTANMVTDALGLPSGATVSFIGQSRLRITTDPRVANFLQRLTTIRASRVLSTSRLFPADLQTVTGEPVHGVAAYFVDGLSDDDAVNLWREFGATGGRQELVSLFNTFGNYPLLIRALAGEVARFRPAPRDFEKWRQAHTEFDPFKLPLVQRKSHVLQYSLSGLTDTERRVLHTIAAFRAPASYDTLAAVIVGPGKACADEVALDMVLSDLEDRGLVGWDKRGNRYDLHPVVRGVAWSVLDPHVKQDIYQSLASYFEALPQVDGKAIKTIDQLTGAIELYHTLIQLNRGPEAADMLIDHLLDSGMTLGAFTEMTELIEMFFQNPILIQRLNEREEEGEAVLTSMFLLLLALFYFLSGDYCRARDAFAKIEIPVLDDLGDQSTMLALESIAFCYTGALANAERSAREASRILEANHDKTADTDETADASGVLAIVLTRRGRYEEGIALVSGTLLEDLSDSVESIILSELTLAALHQDDITSAQAFAQRMGHGEQSSMPALYDQVQAKAVYGAVAAALGEHDRVYDLLSDALVSARAARLTDLEAGLLVQLGEWNAYANHLDTAQRCAEEALQITTHRQLRLRQADAFNLLSSVERARGNQHGAATAAVRAYRLAWCDGPPFSYDWGMRQARENLAAVKEPEPADLPSFSPFT